MVKRVRKHPPISLPARVQMYVVVALDVCSQPIRACVSAWVRVFTSRIYPRLWVVTGRSRNVNTAAVTGRTAGPPIRLDRPQTFPTTRGNRTPTIVLPALFPAQFSFENCPLSQWELLIYGLFLNNNTYYVLFVETFVLTIVKFEERAIGISSEKLD